MLHHLHEEQHYVIDIAEKLGVEPKLLHHSRQTISCSDKLKLLKEENPTEFSGWELDRVVKALYFGKEGSPLIGVITPELDEMFDQKNVFPQMLWMSRNAAAKYWLNTNTKHVPHGMAWGTCTPFPLTSSVGDQIGGLIFVEHKPIWEKEVNISVGGTDKKSFLTSMHIPYGSIYEILKEQFGEDRVRLYRAAR